ncbi:MAG: hypothetical protein ACXQTL_04930 [Methanosarcinales archaeon]
MALGKPDARKMKDARRVSEKLSKVLRQVDEEKNFGDWFFLKAHLEMVANWMAQAEAGV